MIYRYVLVNPWSCEVTCGSWDDRGRKLAELISHPSNPVDTLDFRGMGEGVQMIVDDSAGLKPDIPVWRISGYPYDIPGMTLFLGVSYGGETADVPPRFLSWLETRLAWTDMVTTGKLGPTRETARGIIIGNIILKKKS
jgi:hypothetical protein